MKRNHGMDGGKLGQLGQEAINNGRLFKTVNQMGFMNIGPSDEYVSEFVRFSATADGPVADLGCAFGHKAKLMLDAGAKTVIANDIAKEHLDVFEQTLSEEERKRVILLPGDAIKACSELEAGSLAGVLAANWLHFLEGSDVRKVFGLFYRVLKPGGLLVVVTASHKCGLIKDQGELLRQRIEAGDEWPGWISNAQIQGTTEQKMIPGHMQFIEPEQLVREAKLAGFEVKKYSHVARHDYPEFYRFDGREASGLVAFKPAH
ncbi:hypothetical protein BV898_00586 [Hypsibius exemplaris]|uniref:Methyltransferase domain-containing protein n=1 Tax=Hypsibius exemplaris TaxID=2072580 RepID=A0A1W0XE58_HYPEX|nr:hypothetical protein BV898_00586 [Hypsibius exemplaris]